MTAVFHASSRRDSRSHEATRVSRRKTNRRHMIGDHHGRTAGRATLLVKAADGILGTHTTLLAEAMYFIDLAASGLAERFKRASMVCSA